MRNLFNVVLTFVFLMIIVVLFQCEAFAGSITSDFNTGDFDEWIGGSDPQSSVIMTNQKDAGVSDSGYLHLEDGPYGDSFTIIAPEKFLGDMSSFDGGTMSFDLVMFSPTTINWSAHTRNTGFGRIWINGAGTGMSIDTIINPEYNWTKYTMSFLYSEWEVASEERYRRILADITRIEIQIECIGGIEIMGFDNFIIDDGIAVSMTNTSSVPEPTTILLLTIGLASIFVSKRKV